MIGIKKKTKNLKAFYKKKLNVNLSKYPLPLIYVKTFKVSNVSS